MMSEREKMLFGQIADACKELGWSICVPKYDNIKCIVIGEEGEIEKSSQAIDQLFDEVHHKSAN